MKPSFNVWTRKLDDEDSWQLELSTDDIEQALLLAVELGMDDTIATVYERGRFSAGGRRRAGNVLFWWSENYSDEVRGRPVARGQGWPEGYEDFVTYEPVGTAALASSGGRRAVAEIAPPRRYRMIYCDECGVEIPKNEAVEYTRSVEVGRSSGRYRTSSSFTQRTSPRSFSTSSSFGKSWSSGRTYYRQKTALLCQDCYQKQMDADAASAAFKRKLILIVAGIVFVFGWLNNHGYI